VTETEGRGLPADAETLAQMLGAAGYATGMIGKWHLGTRAEFRPRARGCQTFFGFLPGGHPYLPAGVPALQPWERLMEGDDAVDEPAYLTDAFAREAVDFIVRHRAGPFFLYVAFNAVHGPFDGIPQSYLDRFPDDEPGTTRAFRATLSALDDAVGQISWSIRSLGLQRRTIFVFTSDNGGVNPAGSNAPLRGKKLYLFEGGVRVPLVLRWPGRAPA